MSNTTTTNQVPKTGQLTFAEVIARTSTEDIVTWVLFCSLSTLLAFLLATYDYIKKILSTPAMKRKRRAKRELKKQMEEEKKLKAVCVKPIPVDNFISEWKSRQKKKRLHYEFKEIEHRQRTMPKLSEVATRPENVMKNSGSILPFDHNVVYLVPTGYLQSPYVNASWIDGYDQPRKYIAAQCPNVRGVVDFFELIWQYKIRCIVMLNEVFENGVERGIRYWKEGINAVLQFGEYQITTSAYSTTADFLVRHLDIKHNGQIRHIKQFHLLNWSELDRTNIIGFLEVRRRLQAEAIENGPPVLIHCDNGSGRTGAFICADINLDRMDAGKAIDIFGSTASIRRNRCMMINVYSQYYFVYELVANFISCGCTIMSIENLSKTVQRLALKLDNKNTGFEEELKIINSFTIPLTIGECAGGFREENQWKSRDIMLQPPERSRPYLLTHEQGGGTDYINAVYVDGYSSTNQYIVTQWPLKKTVNDVWRLVFDHNVSVIVVLNDMGKGTRSYPRFWPAVTKQSTGFGPVGVELMREFELTTNIKCRIFRVRKIITDLAPKIVEAMKKYGIGDHVLELLASRRLSEPSRIVVMLQATSWPNRHRIPESTVGLIELVRASEEVYEELCPSERRVSNSPILVMSKDGLSRVGCYCVIHMSTNRMLTEKKIDIFRATEIVKRNRPELIDGISEYLMCYDSCLEFYNRYIRGENNDHVTSTV